ncbi:MAG: alpha/beta fold hydrolase [Phycisphaerales bacterium JB050]
MSASAPHPRLILLPDLGADFHLFLPQLKAFEHSIVPAWIDPTDGSEALRLYAARFTEHLRREGQLDQPFALVGFAFGGSLAMEIARYLLMRRASDEQAITLPTGIVLISSCRSQEAITKPFLRSCSNSGPFPGSLVRPLARWRASRIARANRLDQQQSRWLTEMARTIDPAMLKWGRNALRTWNFTTDEAQAIEREIPILQIRGENDTAAPDPLRDADVTIAGADHFVQWTNAEHVNERIAEFLGLRIEK